MIIRFLVYSYNINYVFDKVGETWLASRVLLCLQNIGRASGKQAFDRSDDCYFPPLNPYRAPRYYGLRSVNSFAKANSVHYICRIHYLTCCYETGNQNIYTDHDCIVRPLLGVMCAQKLFIERKRNH